MQKLPTLKFWIATALACLVACPAQAQQPTLPTSPNAPTAASSTAQRRPSLPAGPLDFTFSIAPELRERDADTLPNAAIRQYDPARQQLIDYGTLGNLGSSARPLFFEIQSRRGFDAGVRPFGLYWMRPENLRFYRNTRSFTEVAYSRGKTQDDGELTARFARTFAGGLTFSLDYRNINNLGQYRYQRTKHNALSFGGWLPVGRRYEAFLVFSKNTSKQQENGGIQQAVLGDGPFGGAITLPIWLSQEIALSRLANRDIQLTQHFKIAGAAKLDSAGREIGNASRRNLRLMHRLTWGSQSSKFADGIAGQTLRSDSSFFGDFLVDRRGVRHYLEVEHLENQFAITTFKPKKTGAGRSDFLAAGLTHTYFNVWQEPERRRFSNLFLNGAAAFTPSERFVFNVRGDLGLLDNIGEYRLEGDLKLGLGKAGELRAALQSQRFPPTLMQQRLFVSKRKVWETDFEKPVTNSLSGAYALPSVGFEAGAATHLLSNFIYFDQSGRPAQTAAALSVSQLYLRENLRLGPLHFDNTIAFQKANRSDVLHLPEWFSKNSLYFSGRLFKKNMLLETGFDFRSNGAFLPDAYQPLNWQFHLADSLANPDPYLWLDFFASFKISNFRVFFRYENLSGLWDANTLFYQTLRYPQPLPALRLGIRWRFMDSNLPENEGSGSGNQPPPGIRGGGGGFRPTGF